MSSKKNQKYFVVLLFLVGGAIATTFLDNQGPKKDPLLNKEILSSSELLKIDQLTASKDEQKVAIKKSEAGLWTIETDKNFPADAKKVIDFLEKLSSIKIQRVAGKSDKKYASFGLDHPLALEVSTGNGKHHFYLGDTRKGGGQYMYLKAGGAAYLITDQISFNLDTESWELKTLLDIEKEQVKGLTFKGKKKKGRFIEIAREKAEDKLALKGLTKKQKQRDSAVHGLDSVLKSFNYTKRYDVGNEEAKTAFLKPDRSTVQLFDGRQYEIEVGKVGKEKTEKHFIRITGIKNNASLDTETERQFTLLNELMKSWAFEVSSYVANKFRKKKDDFIEPKAKS